MDLATSFVAIIEKAVGALRFAANAGRRQLAAQLDTLASTLDRFRQAAREGNAEKMREYLGECETETEQLEERIFNQLNKRADSKLRAIVRGAPIAKQEVAKAMGAISEGQLRNSFKKGRAKLAVAGKIRNDEERDVLIADLDLAIGKLRGLSQSLKNFKL